MKQMEIILLPSSMALALEFLNYDGEDLETLTTIQEGESLKSKKIKDDHIEKMLKQTTIQHEIMA